MMNLRSKKRAEVWKLDNAASIKANLPICVFQGFQNSDGTENTIEEEDEAPATSPYAPKAEGSLYVQVLGMNLSGVFSILHYASKYEVDARRLDQTYLKQSKPYYIPVCFLRSLADNTIQWPKEADMLDPPYNDLSNQPFKYDKHNKAFYVQKKFLHEFIPCQSKHIWIPIRDEDGHLIICKDLGSYLTPGEANLVKKKWAQLMKTIKLSNTNTGDRPARYQTVPADKIKIRIRKAATDRFAERTGGVKKLFQDFIDKINEEKEGNLAELELLDGEEEKVTGPPKDYILLSQHPFGFYTSYISKKGHHEYMTSLLSGCYEKQTDDQFALRGEVETRPLPNQNSLRKLYPPDKKIKRTGENADDMQFRAKDEVKKSDSKVRKSDKDEHGISGPIYVPLSAKKITGAKGKRGTPGVPEPGPVMGGYSAPEIASKILKWKYASPLKRQPLVDQDRTYYDNQMKNGLYIAEWLHLSAFSWGGLLSSSVENQFVGSQISENLVVGTSETNSAMTRYEKAWQKLIRNEDTLFWNDKGDFAGTLLIKRHPSKAPKVDTPAPWVPNNAQQNGNRPIQDRDAEPLKRIDPNKGKIKRTPQQFRPFLKDSILKGQYIIEQSEMGEQEQAIARDFRWICYQFDYLLKLNHESEILRLGAGVLESRTTFYPFMRMLFHKVEHDLDKFLWDDMIKEVKGQMTPSGKAVERKEWPKSAVEVKNEREKAEKVKKQQASMQPVIIPFLTNPSTNTVTKAETKALKKEEKKEDDDFM